MRLRQETKSNLSGVRAQHHEDLAERLFVAARQLRNRMHGLTQIGMARDARELARHLGRRHHQIDTAGGDRASRHPEVLGAALVLGEGHSTGRLDRLQPMGSIRAGPGQDHADGLGPQVVREGLQKAVDRQVQSAILPALQEEQPPMMQPERAIRRDDVDVVGLDRLAVRGLSHRHPGRPDQQIGQHARMCRIQMLDEHEGHTGARRQMVQQTPEDIESAGRGPDPDDRENVVLRLGISVGGAPALVSRGLGMRRGLDGAALGGAGGRLRALGGRLRRGSVRRCLRIRAHR
jgi:hypothetical protein